MAAPIYIIWWPPLCSLLYLVDYVGSNHTSLLKRAVSTLISALVAGCKLLVLVWPFLMQASVEKCLVSWRVLKLHLLMT